MYSDAAISMFALGVLFQTLIPAWPLFSSKRAYHADEVAKHLDGYSFGQWPKMMQKRDKTFRFNFDGHIQDALGPQGLGWIPFMKDRQSLNMLADEYEKVAKKAPRLLPGGKARIMEHAELLRHCAHMVS